MIRRITGRLHRALVLVMVLSLVLPYVAFAETVNSQIVSNGANGLNIGYEAGNSTGINVKYWIANTADSQCDPAVGDNADVYLKATRLTDGTNNLATAEDVSNKVYAKVGSATAQQLNVAAGSTATRFALAFTKCGTEDTNTKTVNFTTTSSAPAGQYKVEVDSVDDTDQKNPYGGTHFFLNVSASAGDTTAPSAPSTPDLADASDSGSSDTDNLTNDTTPTFTGTAEAGSTVKIYDGTSLLGTTMAGVDGTWTFTVPADLDPAQEGNQSLSDGAHSIKATATDAAGNTSADSGALSITVDTAAPDATITVGPAADSFVSSRSASFSFTSETGSTFDCKLDSGDWASCTSPKEYTDLSERSHTFQVRAIDRAGNVDGDPASRTWTVDVTAPAVAVASPANGSTTDDITPTFSGTAEAGSTLELYIDRSTTAATTIAVGESGSWSYTLPESAALSGHSHSVYATARDAAGNLGTSVTNSFTLNRAPTATVELSPSAPKTNQTLTATATKADADNDDVTLTFVWKNGNTVVKQTDASTGLTDTLDLSQTGNGNKGDTITVTVTPNDGRTNGTAATANVTVANSAPVANAGDDQTVNEGTSTGFRGSATDADDDQLTYSWSFGDGTAAESGQNVSHTYADGPNRYTATLTASDSDGSTGNDTTNVTVNNVAPTATFNKPARVDEGSDISLSLSDADDVSSADKAAGFTYRFDCNTDDASGYSDFGTSSSVECPTDDNGTRNVSAQIQDKDGGVSTYTGSVTIDNVAPTAILALSNPLTANEGDTKTYTFSVSDPGTYDTIQSISVSCGVNGTLASTVSATSRSFACTFPDGPASSTVSVKATDSDGAEGAADTQTVGLSNVKPTIGALSLSNNTATACLSGNSVGLSFSFSDPAGLNDT